MESRPVSLEQAVEQLRGLPGVVPGERIIAAMSGGVDSSVMAALLHRAGYEVIGVSMQLFDKARTGGAPGSSGRCCSLDDFQDARRVAHQMGFAHYVMDFESQFQDLVIRPFIESYMTGETPSPCILCNKYLKFELLMDTANELQAGHVATGHYARIAKRDNSYHLVKAADLGKDQTYFLFSLTQEALSRALFPLESYSKPRVRELGRQLGLHLTEKSESQEICFVQEDRYDQFIEQQPHFTDPGAGPIKHLDGRTLGTHSGFWHFTIGQRKGLGIANPSPLYVVRLDPALNTVWVAEDHLLYGSSLVAKNVTWCVAPPDSPLRCLAKLRSRSSAAPARVEILCSDRIQVVFDTPQRAITPGQAIVLYRDDEVLGGGWVCRED